VLPAPGHTPGQLAVEIDGPDGAIYLADAVVDELAIEHPDWGMAFDDDPATAAATRRALIERASAEHLLVAAAHLPGPGRIERSGGRLRFVA
jgi:glyoxylase-like metal-dependent hydrolase (beta-lactamase superfamily II)